MEELHRIEKLCQSLMRDGKKGQEPAVFVPKAAEAIASEVDKYLPSVELNEIVDTLTDLAEDIEEQMSSPCAAQVLRKVLERGVVVTSLQKLNEDLHSSSASRARFLAFTGGPKRLPPVLTPARIPTATIVRAGFFGLAKRV